MNQACIMDTIVHAMSTLLENKSAILALLIIFVFVTLFNFLVVSGSGKAVIVMPILQPLGEILHINQQVLVLAYQYGDGITNSFWPGSSLVQLSMCGVDYGSWIKFCWKTYLSFIVSAFVLVIIAYALGYGPFLPVSQSIKGGLSKDRDFKCCMGDVIVHDAERGGPDAGGHGICTGKRAGDRDRAAGEHFDSCSGEDYRLS